MLVDATGDRRYWIIPIVKSQIDIQQLKQERDNIWSAAVRAYRNGERWWLDRDEQVLSSNNNQIFQVVDEWQSAIAKYLEYRERVSISEILTEVMEMRLGEIDRRSQMRVANILTYLKWEKVGQQQHQGKRQVVWELTKPPSDIAEVLQDETQSQQSSSIPTTPNSEHSSETQQNNKKLEIEPPLSDPKEINWLSYPYNSGDINTLQNRANKVKERVLSCGTSNELIALHADRKVSTPEIKWIKENLLSGAELLTLVRIENTKQGNLFAQDSSSVREDKQPKLLEWQEIKSEIDEAMKRLGWSQEQGRDYLVKTYGVKSRLYLTDEQLIEFADFLKNK